MQKYITCLCKIHIHMNAYIKLSCPYTLYKHRLLPSGFPLGKGHRRILWWKILTKKLGWSIFLSKQSSNVEFSFTFLYQYLPCFIQCLLPTLQKVHILSSIEEWINYTKYLKYSKLFNIYLPFVYFLLCLHPKQIYSTGFRPCAWAILLSLKNHCLHNLRSIPVTLQLNCPCSLGCFKIHDTRILNVFNIVINYSKKY